MDIERVNATLVKAIGQLQAEEVEAIHEAKGLSASEKNKAVKAMRLYLGSVDYSSVRDQQKLYDKVHGIVEKWARKFGMLSSDVLDQLETAARKAGPIRPIPGRDI